MNDYRKAQIEELLRKIEEAKALLNDPVISELAAREIKEFEVQKKALEQDLLKNNGAEEDGPGPESTENNMQYSQDYLN